MEKNIQKPNYDLDKIKFGIDEATFLKAVGLYEGKKVTRFKSEAGCYTAVVLGTKPYRVLVERRGYNKGFCECYLGQNDTLCKHMVAVAIYAVKNGQPLKKEEKEWLGRPVCSGKLGELSKEELMGVKKSLTQAAKYIKPYSGPSRIWFAYQNSLCEGCHRLAAIISKLPVGEPIAKLLVDLLLRLDKRLCTGGVDDSEGTVGGFIEETVGVLEEFARLEPKCINAFEKLVGQKTCFGWEEPLVRLFKFKLALGDKND